MPHRLESLIVVSGILLACSVTSGLAAAEERPEIGIEREAVRPAYDVVVYGGTSAGIAAAIEVARGGLSVLVIEPSRHVGGLSAGGLGATDIGNKAAIGGISRDFYKRLGKKYGRDESWTFEPHVAETVFHEMLFEAKVPVVFEERLDLTDGVEKNRDGRIVSITMESGLKISGRIFIDATYEGDLMAKGGVSYHVGRESNATYGESLNGVQKKNARSHQFIKPVDPYVEPGKPESGVLPGVHDGDPGEDGTGDKRIQAYCFRMCTTNVKDNQVPWEKPENYDPQRFELLLRNFEAGDHRLPFLVRMMPNGKTDTNNKYAFSTDNIGKNYGYPEGDYETRAKIVQDHYDYQKGLMWTIANNPRVPKKLQDYANTWRPAKDEFVDNDHWPHQLYVREARRMISDYVMTQHDCQGRRRCEDPVGLAAYTMDSHHVQRYVTKDGTARNEGDVQVGGFPPYPISYRSIRPKKSECGNLLVPTCPSSSHIAFGSIRMEPVFMVLGQSAGAAAALAIAKDIAVQDVEYSNLRETLEQNEQVLEWTGPRSASAPILLRSLKGIVIDDGDAELEGEWLKSASIAGFAGKWYRHDDNKSKGAKIATYKPRLESAGEYEVRIAYTANANRATNVPVTIESADGKRTVTLDQRKSSAGGLKSLGTFRFDPRSPARVVVSNQGTNGYVVIDAVQFRPVESK